MNVVLTGDPHLGHKTIHKFRNYVSSCEDNIDLFIKQWEEKVTKRTRVIILGDAIFDKSLMDMFRQLPGEKVLVKGNHDDDKLRTAAQMTLYKELYGLLKYKNFWLSHAPIHPLELRGRYNVHGHVHDRSIPDDRYINVCQDVLYPETGSIFISLEDLVEKRRKLIEKENDNK